MSDEGSLFGAFGAVLGYIGAEAATDLWFSSLLWPQRSFSHITPISLPKLALLMPMGGPLHKAALKTFDDAFSHGLFNGPYEGHMLGTPFFEQLDWSYTIQGDKVRKGEPRAVRNCLWGRALRCMPLPAIVSSGSVSTAEGDGGEKGLPRGEKNKGTRPLRAKVAVHHLSFARATDSDIGSARKKLPLVREDCGQPRLQVFFAICVAETSGIAVAVALGSTTRSLWCILWLAPLLLRLLSAVFALHREPLTPAITQSADEKEEEKEESRNFIINCPSTQGNFMVFTGPPALIQQFFRHYGHPIRSRPREVFQLLLIVLFAALFPLGLLCSVIWMPKVVQYTWTCYQLYVVLAMHIVRYTAFGSTTTTEAGIVEPLGREDGENHCQNTVLFGNGRRGAGTLKVSLTTTYHERHNEGKEYMDRLLGRGEGGS